MFIIVIIALLIISYENDASDIDPIIKKSVIRININKPPLLDQSLKTDEFTLDTTAAETAVDNELSWRQSDAFCRTLDQLHFFVGQQLFDIETN